MVENATGSYIHKSTHLIKKSIIQRKNVFVTNILLFNIAQHTIILFQ